MTGSSSLDWATLHRDSAIVDLHIHPSLQQQLFHRNLNWRYVISRLNPLSVRASFPRLKEGGYDAIFSVIHVPEKGILQDFPIVNVFRFLRPDLWAKIFAPAPFNVALRMMDDMETAVADSAHREQGINFISRTIQHLVSVGGEDVVGIGTDFDGFTTPPDDLMDASQMPRLTQRLLIDGYSREQIIKILGGNALRAVREGWGKKT